jgi:hypothetical protein
MCDIIIYVIPTVSSLMHVPLRDNYITKHMLLILDNTQERQDP